LRNIVECRIFKTNQKRRECYESAALTTELQARTFVSA
jgi:hypothetical protein